MSDLQDLIHRQAVISYEQGARTERLRIIKLLRIQIEECGKDCEYCTAQKDAIALIGGVEVA